MENKYNPLKRENKIAQGKVSLIKGNHVKPLKGEYRIAQGNALGRKQHNKKRPERTA